MGILYGSEPFVQLGGTGTLFRAVAECDHIACAAVADLFTSHIPSLTSDTPAEFRQAVESANAEMAALAVNGLPGWDVADGEMRCPVHSGRT
jgi:hypothetical protein